MSLNYYDWRKNTEKIFMDVDIRYQGNLRKKDRQLVILKKISNKKLSTIMQNGKLFENLQILFVENWSTPSTGTELNIHFYETRHTTKIYWVLRMYLNWIFQFCFSFAWEWKSTISVGSDTTSRRLKTWLNKNICVHRHVSEKTSEKRNFFDKTFESFSELSCTLFCV